MGETRREGGVKQDEAAGRRASLGEICRLLFLDLIGLLNINSVCASVFVYPSAPPYSSHPLILSLPLNLSSFLLLLYSFLIRN